MQRLKRIIVSGIVLLILGLSTSVLYTKYKNTVNESARLKTNLEFYQSKCEQSDSTNIVLRHTAAELSSSRDSLIQRIDSLRKELKLRPKNIQTIVSTETVIRDTIRDTIPVTLNFTATVKPNSQTSIEVIRQDSSLTVIPDIRNEQTVLVYTEEKYKYKCWFSRLIHLNFKKIRKDKYVIENSNDLIKTGESRVINIVD